MITIDKLFKIIEDRQKKMPEKSYVASLFREGRDRIIQKVGEEAVEVVIAAKNKEKQRVISEVADLWFHTLVMLCFFNIKPKDLMKEFQKRLK